MVLLGSTAVLTVLAAPARSQSGISEEQRRAYANQFVTSGATKNERAILKDIQENRVSVQSSIKAIQDFIVQSPSIKSMQAGATPELGMLMFWNGISLDATSLDHTTETDDPPVSTFGEQIGPARSSRALAIVHLAMYEAVNTIYRRFKSYNDLQAKIVSASGVPVANISPATASVKAAIIESAYETLKSLYPKKEPIFKAARQQSVVLIGEPAAASQLGSKIGIESAAAVLAARSVDGSTYPDLTADNFASNDPLKWRKDPVTQLPPALGGNWHRVRPFVVASADKYRPKPPPVLGDADFITAYKAVKRLGGDPTADSVAPRWPTQTDRTNGAVLDAQNETFKGIFWAYDGTASLCAPPRLYNMVATSIALSEKPIEKVEEMARFLALINVAMCDAGICAWEAKYHYAYARPISAIRATGADTTTEGQRDPNWTPLGAPVSNGMKSKRNLTPPFPAYPSGHATFGGALFEIMRLYWGLPEAGVPFTFVSDEYNGVNRGPGDAQPRPLVRRPFKGFDEAELENAQSRIWLGIHWQFDADAGIQQGRLIARDVFANAFG
jgi:hypothetical protein